MPEDPEDQYQDKEEEYYEEDEEYADDEEYEEEGEDQEELDDAHIQPSGIPPAQTFIQELPANAATEYETMNDVNFATNSGLIRRDYDADEYRIYEELRRRKHL